MSDVEREERELLADAERDLWAVRVLTRKRDADERERLGIDLLAAALRGREDGRGPVLDLTLLDRPGLIAREHRADDEDYEREQFLGGVKPQ